MVKQWREEKVNPWENAFVRWMLLLPAHAREEGIEQGKIQLIRGMHKYGMPLENIANFTGISTEKIRKLLL